jgi:hypothetical protein
MLMGMWVIAGVIIAFVVVGQIMQVIKTRRSRQALASDDATAMLRGTDGLHITEVDGNDLFVREIALIPGAHRIAFQVSKYGGIVNIPAADYELQSGVTSVEWSGTTAQDMRILLFREVDDGTAAVAR